MDDRVLLLDSCVWRDAAHDRSWLRRAADGSRPIAVCSEAIEELVVAAVLARSDEESEEVRVACRLVVRYAEILLPPAAWYFAAKAGLRASAAPDARLVCDWVAACDGREQVRSR